MLPSPAPLNIADFEALARARMDPAAYDYYAGAAGDERTLLENRRAFDRLALRPRVLVDVSTVTTATILLGETLSLPLLLAPTAFNRLGHPDGELAAARAAGRAGTLMVASTMASSSIEEIAGAATGPLWFQLYIYRDREVTREFVARARAAGYRALVLTVDAPRLGRRERDARNNFALPPGITVRNLETSKSGAPAKWNGQSSFFEYAHHLFDPSVSWDAVAWLRSLTDLPILLKGVLHPDDAARAVREGVDGIVVSNHGGRQLDGAIASADALPPIVDCVAGRIPVLLDGGVRRGVDVLKALCLGAAAVLVGRPYLWGLAAAGEDGVYRVLELLREELELAMALAGCPTVASAAKSLVATPRE